MVKALFGDETVVATVNPVVIGSANNLVPPVNTQQVVPVSNVQPLTTIDDNAIDSLGDQSRMQLSALSGKMLGSVRASDMDAFGAKLNELVATAKGMNPADLGKGGLLTKITHFFGSAKEKMLAQYETVEKRMDAIVAELNKSIALHAARITDLEAMYNTNYQSHQALEAAAAQGTQIQAQLEAGLAQLKAAGATDSFAAQKISDLAGKIDRLAKHIDDLNRVMLLAKQTAPEIRLLQNNARTLVTKFKDAETLTIPAWKNVFTLYIVQLEQKKGADLATAVDDSTNAAFNAQADMLRSNTQLIAKAGQRSVIDIQTLEHVQQQLLGSFDDLQKITEDGKKARAEAEPKLKALEQELISRFVPKK